MQRTKMKTTETFNAIVERYKVLELIEKRALIFLKAEKDEHMEINQPEFKE